jgi:hypothetical protein
VYLIPIGGGGDNKRYGFCFWNFIDGFGRLYMDLTMFINLHMYGDRGLLVLDIYGM